MLKILYRIDAQNMGVDFSARLVGRFAAENVKKHVKAGELITAEIAKAIQENDAIDSVRIMSVLSNTNSRGISQKSYGIDLATGELVAPNYPIGVIAAQSIGEPGTQLSLDSKHRAGAVTAGDDVTQGLTRVEELLEVRVPKGQAFLSDITGTVNAWDEEDQYIVQITAQKQKPIKTTLGERRPKVNNGDEVVIGDLLAAADDGTEPIHATIPGKVSIEDGKIIITPTSKSVVRYEIPSFRQLLVKDGDEVKAGQRLTNGSINLQELMRLSGVEETQRYIINEILYIFASQGQNIADKHLEVIVRQMFSRLQVEDSGDSEFITGDVVSKQSVLDTNAELLSKGKQPIRYNQLLLGITKASLSTDSFLSAASFQDTTRVLIAAATSGKVDHLYGLKENVILGRRIPVGTGVVQSIDEEDDELHNEAEIAEVETVASKE
jgi:DNA-directed RNA polymerase subunit beta'